MLYTSSWRSPSNIALIKYWGKRDIQLPCNPSISFTLSACHTKMKMDVELEEASRDLMVMYDGEEKISFLPKMKSFFERLTDDLPWLAAANLTIDSVNTFPHGAGIASSASAMSAAAVCLVDIDDQINGRVSTKDDNWWRRVSFFARLGSGSACRSVFPVAALWGTTPGISGSNDEYAIPWGDSIAPFYRDYHDTILIVSAGEKSVSSSAGHELMSSLPFAQTRYAEAGKNMLTLIDIMHDNDRVNDFISICESEALQLHALMMSGKPPYLLIEPGTISVIKEVWRFREETGTPVCFTLDAGPNVHLLYPAAYGSIVMDWIKNELTQYCTGGQYIHDNVGSGPEKLV